MTATERIQERIERREAVVCVVGLGYVGLPLAVTFAEAGFSVVGVDTDAARVSAVNKGRSHVPDVPSETVARLVSSQWSVSQGGLSAATGYDAVCEADAVLICVPTPLGKTRDPDVSHIVAAASEVGPRLREGALVVLESTTYPGTTEELVLPRLVEGHPHPDPSTSSGQALPPSRGKGTSGRGRLVGKLGGTSFWRFRRSGWTRGGRTGQSPTRRR